MAIHAHSTPVPAFQPRLLRGGGVVPCHVLTSAEVVDLLDPKPPLSIAGILADFAARISRTRRPQPLSPLSTPLPSLTSAFARRRGIVGAFDGEANHG